MGEQLVFYAFAGLVTLCSLMVVVSRNPVSGAIFLVMDFFLLAGIYALMEAHFVAVIQVLVYAGAIVVLFLFVIMLLNLQPEQLQKVRISPVEGLVLAFTVLGFGIISLMVLAGETPEAIGSLTAENIEQAGGNTFVLGKVLFVEYLWPFELASILILLAMVASITIAKKDETTTGKKVSKRRVSSGSRG